MTALIRLLTALATLARLKNGGEENDLSILLNYARMGLRAGDTGKRYLQAAADKVEQLVREDRGLNDQERADLDAAIRGKLARAAGVVVPSAPAADPPAPPETSEPPAPPAAPSDTVSFPGS